MSSADGTESALQHRIRSTAALNRLDELETLGLMCGHDVLLFGQKLARQLPQLSSHDLASKGAALAALRAAVIRADLALTLSGD